MSARSIVFTTGDVPLAGRLHEPEGGGGGPAVVVAGSWLTVKEQMADAYAAELARRGWTALTFDFAGFGASGGTLRQAELPTRKIADLTAAVRFLGSRSGPPVLLGVCASAQYAMAAVAGGAPVRGLASVAGWFHDTDSVAAFYGGADGVRQRMEAAAAAADHYLATGELTTVPAYRADDQAAGMFVEMDYYANPDRGGIPQWRNEMAVLSWAHWLGFDGLAAAEGVEVPAVFVHSDGAVFPDHVRALADRVRGPVRLVWGEGEQTDWYDRPARITQAVDAIEETLR